MSKLTKGEIRKLRAHLLSKEERGLLRSVEKGKKAEVKEAAALEKVLAKKPENFDAEDVTRLQAFVVKHFPISV